MHVRKISEVTAMPKNKFKYDFTEDEITLLQHTFETSAPASTLHKRAAVLLALANNTDEHLTVLEIASKCETNHTTVQTIKSKLMDSGFESALFHAKQVRKPTNPIITEEIEEKLLALIKQAPPDGASRWTVRSLASECIRLGYVQSITSTTIHRYLTKKGIRL